MTYPARTACAGVSPMNGQPCPMREQCANHRKSAYLVVRTQWRCGPGVFNEFRPRVGQTNPNNNH